jgi:hypothetical protein
MEALIEECQQAKEHGRTESQLIELMHERGMTITESIKALMQIYKIPLSAAKEKVASNPCWRDIVKAAEPLHDQFAESIQQELKD